MGTPTEFGVNHPLARKHWSNALAVEANEEQYFYKFMGTGDDAIVKVQTELEKNAGDEITVGLRMALTGDGVEGDNTLEGSDAEEGLNYFSDKVKVDQRRKSSKSKGKASEQRVPFSVRDHAKGALTEWWAEDFDAQLFIYLSGDRGSGPIEQYHVATDFAGRAGNAIEAPSSNRIVYGGNATGFADLDAADIYNVQLLERLRTKVSSYQRPKIRPVKVNGEKKFINLMHPFQAHALRNSTSDNDWVAIQKAAGVRGGKNLLFQNALGEYAGFILHEHPNVISFATGDKTNLTVDAARALVLGAQAGMIAWAAASGDKKNRFDWHEEEDDRGNQLVVSSGSIYGVKKSRFNNEDFGVIAVDTAAVNPA